MKKQGGRGIRVRVPGSSANLGPGFDALGMAINLYLDMQAVPCSGRSQVVFQGEGAGEVPLDGRNLILTAIRRFCRSARCPVPRLHLTVHNAIPLYRGLGSSGAAIVGGLLIAARSCGLPLRRDALLQLAAAVEGHPDNVSASLYGGITLSHVAAGRVHCEQMSPPSGMRLLAVVPALHVPTKRARAILPARIRRVDAVFNVQRATLLVHRLQTGNLRDLQRCFEDRLHQPYRARLVPGFHEVVAAGLDAGAAGVYLSGAGPSIMAVYSRGGRAIAAAMTTAFRRRGIPATAYHLQPVVEAPTVEWL